MLQKENCTGCGYLFRESGNIGICLFYNSDQCGKTDENKYEELMKRVDVNDTGAIYLLVGHYSGILGSGRETWFQ